MIEIESDGAIYAAISERLRLKEIAALEDDRKMLRAAWMRRLQVENECGGLVNSPGKPCHSHKCGCALEMQQYIDAERSHQQRAADK